MKKATIYIISILTLLFNCAFGKVNTDSLENIVSELKGAEKVQVLADLCWYLKNTNSDKAFAYGEQAVEEATLLGDSALIAQAYNDLSTVIYHRGNFEKSINYNKIALRIRKNIADTMGVASSLSKIGNCYHEMGDYETALSYFLDALEIFEHYGHLSAIGMSADNIGSIYRIIGLPAEAIPFHRKAMTANTEAGNVRGLANATGNLALTMSYKSKSDSVFYYYYAAIRLYKQIEDNIGLSTAYNNLAVQYKARNQEDSVLTLYLKAYRLVEKMQDKASLGVYAKNLANAYQNLGDMPLAKKYYEIALRCSRETNSLPSLFGTYQAYAKYLTLNGDNTNAYIYLDSAMMYKDSILNENTSKVVADLEKKYESEKKDAAIILLNKENALEKELIQRQKIQLYGTGMGILLLIALSLAIYGGYKHKQKANHIITVQNEELNMQNEELEAQRDEIERQKVSIETVHAEIKDSIIYAKRIQNAILPTEERIKVLLPDSFVLYKPKDVVAGDFYWIEQVNSTILFAAADCTGHGVPGAMVSVVCHNALNRALREYKLIDPGKILDKTRAIVKEELSKSNEDVKDGMDIALCSIAGNTLLYAGAHNPLWVIRGSDLIEVKANKQPIGIFENAQPFQTHKIDIQKNDTIYVFSDGYVDQFGGTNDKKYSTKRFREQLLALRGTPMKEQLTRLEQSFMEWKAGGSQLDDVCVFGVRV